VAYPHNLVRVKPLIETLKTLKTPLEHELLGRIIHLSEEATLMKAGSTEQKYLLLNTEKR
jgi:hypothetical protein